MDLRGITYTASDRWVIGLYSNDYDDDFLFDGMKEEIESGKYRHLFSNEDFIDDIDNPDVIRYLTEVLGIPIDCIVNGNWGEEC